jgi:tellurite resistance protein TerC
VIAFAPALAFASETKQNFVDLHIEPWVWPAFLALISTLLVLDLLVVHRHAQVISTKAAAIESAVWVSLGLSFALVVLAAYGSQAAGEYVSGYLIELSLSVDNVFVWAIIMSYFAVPREYQFRVLFWGVFGAVVLRFAFIFVGIELLQRFEWMLFVFGGFLVFTAIRLFRHEDEQIHPENNPVLKVVRRVIPSTTGYRGQAMFVREAGRRLATPLFAVLIVIETSDVIFAVDSIPAILAVSREQFIVFSSNAFAILGLRSMYFVLADLRDKFDYLQTGLAIILAFVGFKMIISEWYHIPTFVSLGVIALVLAGSVIASIKLDRPGSDAAIDAHFGEGLELLEHDHEATPDDAGPAD